MVEQANRSRRTRAREAKRAQRQASLSGVASSVRAGLSGGQYRPLGDGDVRRIHEQALLALEQVGLADAPPSGVDAMSRVGAQLGDDGRLRFPPALVEDMLALSPNEFTLHARDAQYDLQIGERRVHFGTAGAAVHVVDVEGRHYRESNLADLYEAARLVEGLDNIHFFQRPLVCRDIGDNLGMDLNTIYAAAAGTGKHIGTSVGDPSHMPAVTELLQELAGGESAWRTRPFVSLSSCFVVPPMKFATDACRVMELAIHAGMPVLLLSAGQAGATSPTPLAMSIVQAVAECLAGVVYVNAIKPGHPVIFGTWPFVSDLRTGAMSGGSGEQALLSAGCAQMHHFYGLPGGAAAGIADSKLPDMQAGWEQAISNAMAGLSGVNLIYEAVGMHASLLGFCMESLVLGDDMLGQILRCVRGIEVNDQTLSLEAMKSVCLDGPGHYLGHPQTLAMMQSEYVYPRIANRGSPKEWDEQGKPDLIAKAIARKQEILAASKAPLIDAAVDRKIRAHFPIHLDVGAGNR